MTKNDYKVQLSSRPAVLKPETSASENIPVFLIFAVAILAVSLLSSTGIFLQPPSGDGSKAIADSFVWLAESPEMAEGLYQLSPKQLKENFPAIQAVLSEKYGSGPQSPVTAISYASGKPEVVDLPPAIANVFFQPIAINRADENVLTSLPGIGPVLARNIVLIRQQNGYFRSKEELLQVPGIGPKKLTALTDHIIID